MKKKIILSTVLPIMGAVGVGGAIAAVSTSCSKVESFDQKLELKYDNSDKRWEVSMLGVLAPKFGSYAAIYTTSDDEKPHDLDNTAKSNVGPSRSQVVNLAYTHGTWMGEEIDALVVGFPRPSDDPEWRPLTKTTVECWGTKDTSATTTSWTKIHLNFDITFGGITA